MKIKTAAQDNIKDKAQEIRQHTESLLPAWLPPAKEKVNNQTSYVCPLCDHGKNGDGLALNPKSTAHGLKCFACGFSGSIIDLYSQARKVNFSEAVEELGKLAGIRTAHPTAEIAPPAPAAREVSSMPVAEEKDQGRYLVNTEQNLFTLNSSAPAWEYLAQRGISKVTAEQAHLGYDSIKQRIIIPTITQEYLDSYEARDITGRAKCKVLSAPGEGMKGIFNFGYMFDDIPYVFLVEGPFDALSVMEAGHNAIALCSTDNVNKFITMLDEKADKQKQFPLLFICLDNDEPGRKAQEKLAAELAQRNLSFITADINGAFKDASEHLEKDRQSFLTALNQAVAQRRPDNMSSYFAKQLRKDIDTFRSEIKTGFEDYDNFTGGLYSGLYVLGAISALGKTTFCHQLADQLAENGQEVLFFSLEQSRLEMASKSIAREIAKLNPGRLGQPGLMNSIQLRRNGFKGAGVAEVMASYLEKVGDRLSVIEGNFNCNAAYIAKYVRSYISRTGARPVVIIDYLQVIPATEQNGRQPGAKEKADATMVELKQLSRELNLCVIVISSVNRINYLTPINFESFKESGGIEYTADVVLGLQLSILSKDKALEDKDEQKEKAQRRKLLDLAKRALPREVELVILKNRFGHMGGEADRIYFTYYPQHDYFTKDITAEFGKPVVW